MSDKEEKACCAEIYLHLGCCYLSFMKLNIRGASYLQKENIAPFEGWLCNIKSNCICFSQSIPIYDRTANLSAYALLKHLACQITF